MLVLLFVLAASPVEAVQDVLCDTDSFLVATSNNRLIALDAHSGSVVGHTHLLEDIPRDELDSTKLVGTQDGILVHEVSGQLAGREVKSGRLLWFSRSPSGRRRPWLVRGAVIDDDVDGRLQAFSLHDGRILAWDRFASHEHQDVVFFPHLGRELRFTQKEGPLFFSASSWPGSLDWTVGSLDVRNRTLRWLTWVQPAQVLDWAGDRLLVAGTSTSTSRVASMELKSGDTCWNRTFRRSLTDVKSCGDKILISAGPKQHRALVALSAMDGKDAWMADLDPMSVLCAPGLGIALVSLDISKSGVSVLGIQLESGKQAWARDFGRYFDVRAVCGAVGLVADESTLEGVDARTGAQIWSRSIRD